MKKIISLVLVILLVAMAIPALGQETAVLDRLNEYNDNLPPAYGTISADDMASVLAERGEDVVLLDVREAGELEERGYIDGSINIPIRELPANLAALPDLDAEIFVICQGGARAMLAQAALNLLGYENAQTMKGGFGAWVGEEFPIVEGEMPAAPEMGEAPEFDEDVLAAVSTYLSELPEGFGLVRAAALNEELIENPDIVLIDTRSEDEWNSVGYIDGAQWIWIDEFMANVDMLPEDKDATIVIYCASSYRGGIATVMMNMLGYTNVRNLVGGLNAWIAEDLPLVGGEES